MRVLDLFSGAGGAALGYSQAGFEVVGIDINPQPHYPFEFIQADALSLSLDFIRAFDFIHASPPCPRYTALKTAPNAKGDAHPDLITPTRPLLQRSGKPWVIENVEGAKKYLIDPVMLCGTSFGLETPPYRTAPNGFELQRHRLFEVSDLRSRRRHAGTAAARPLAFMAAIAATASATRERTTAPAPTCRWSSALPPWACRSDR